MPARTRSRSNSSSSAVNGTRNSPGALKDSEQSAKSQPRKRSTSQSRRSAERSSSKSKDRSRSRSRSRSRTRNKSQSDKEGGETNRVADEAKSGKKESRGRQKTPPRPRAPAELEAPTRSSARLRERQTKESEEVDAASVKKTVITTVGMPDSPKPVPKTREYSFGGPFGSLALLVVLPLVVHLLNFVCLGAGGRRLTDPTSWFAGVSLADCYDAKTCAIFVGWFLFQAVIACLPVGGKRASGLPLHGTGERLSYNCNGLYALAVTLFALASGVAVDMRYGNGRLSWLTYAVDHYFQLMVAATAFSALLSVVLYLKSLRAAAHCLAPEANSGIFVYDFFMGHELNPRIGSFDLKFFCELRPGLIGWVMLDIAFCVKFWQLNGHWNIAMLLVTVFHLVYVADALYFEEAILSTMDIIHEGFGFMLAFGDLVWVPFTYTLTVQFLLTAPAASGLCRTIELVGALVLCLVGYWIFRGANSQKDQFRRNPRHPSVATFESIPTSSGRRLLAGGWWGIVRHPNYLGDIVMSVAWSVPCGFGAPLPWFYPAYLTALLVGRELRDEHSCIKKHGHGWKKYQELVPYRIFPRVF